MRHGWLPPPATPLASAQNDILMNPDRLNPDLNKFRPRGVDSAAYTPPTAPTTTQPWRIGMADGSPLALAGIWEMWSTEGQAPLLSCAVIVTGWPATGA